LNCFFKASSCFSNSSSSLLTIGLGGVMGTTFSRISDLEVVEVVDVVEAVEVLEVVEGLEVCSFPSPAKEVENSDSDSVSDSVKSFKPL